MQRKQDFLPCDLVERVVQFPRHCGHWPTGWDTRWSVSYPHDLAGLAIDVNQAPERRNHPELISDYVVLRVVLFNAVGKYIHWSSAKFFKSFPSEGCCRFRPEDPSKKGPEFTVGLGTPNLIEGFLCGLSIDGEQVVTFAFGGKSDIDRQSVYRFPRL